MGRRRRKGRPVTGVLLLDKPAGVTSNGALQRVKRLYDARKAGHTGSLDPIATGLLPICFGEATKISTYLLDADKRYWVRMKLGEKTETADSEGEIIETAAVPSLSEAQIVETLKGFEGPQMQIPPMYSAVKHQGKRLYELAREGIEVKREPRPVHLYEVNLVNQAEDSLELDVRCSKGTYVRTLVEDIAWKLGTLAHVTALRRTGVGALNDSEMLNMAQIEALAEQGNEALDAQLLGLETALAHWPVVSLDANSSFYAQRGEAVQVSGAPTEGWVRIQDQDGQVIGLGEILDDGRVSPRRLLKQQ